MADYAAPAYSLTFDERPGYLLARVAGPEDSLEVSVSFWQEIAAEADRRKSTHLLVWENFPNNVDTIDMMRVATFLTELGFADIRIAFLDERHEQLDRNRFGELVAVNRGLRGKVFADFAEAESWLLSE